MDTCIKNYVEEKTKELIAAPSCYQGLRDLAEKWLNSKDTPEEAAVTKEYLAALEADVLSIDALIAFAGSEKGIQDFLEMNRQKLWFHRRRQLKQMALNIVSVRRVQQAVQY